MKKTINYEKDILFKTNIGEISSISLEHDFTVDGGYLKGDFIVSGEYKATELSINKESFEYKLPLEYELEENIDLDSLSYDVENFEYNVKDDCLTVYIDFGIRYEEKEITPVIPDEKELNIETIELPRKVLEIKEEETKEVPKNKPLKEEKKEERLETEEKDAILNTISDSDNFVTYHVHIVRENETLEEIAKKYNTTIQKIEEYNNIESIELKTKLIIPEELNE